MTGFHQERWWVQDFAASLPARLFGAAKEQPPPESQRFIAQAEFYFDCPTVWQSIQCNKGSAALYQMSWRARLRLNP